MYIIIFSLIIVVELIIIIALAKLIIMVTAWDKIMPDLNNQAVDEMRSIKSQLKQANYFFDSPRQDKSQPNTFELGMIVGSIVAKLLVTRRFTLIDTVLMIVEYRKRLMAIFLKPNTVV